MLAKQTVFASVQLLAHSYLDSDRDFDAHSMLTKTTIMKKTKRSFAWLWRRFVSNVENSNESSWNWWSRLDRLVYFSRRNLSSLRRKALSGGFCVRQGKWFTCLPALLPLKLAKFTSVLVKASVEVAEATSNG